MIAYEQIQLIENQENELEFRFPTHPLPFKKLMSALLPCDTESLVPTTPYFTYHRRTVPRSLLLDQRIFEELLSLGLTEEPIIADMNCDEEIEKHKSKRVKQALIKRNDRTKVQQNVTLTNSEDDSWSENDPNDEELLQLTIGECNEDPDDDHEVVLTIEESEVILEEVPFQDINTSARIGMRYHDYSKCRDKIDQLYLEYDANSYKPKFSKLAKKYKLSKSNVRAWWLRYQSDRLWRPYLKNCVSNRRLFTDDQERSIADYILEEFIDKNIGVTLRQLRKILLTFYNEFLFNDIDEQGDADEFDFESARVMYGTRKFLFAFLKRNGLSFKKLRTLRRPAVDEDEVATFQNSVLSVRRMSTLHILVNADESNWLVVQPPKKIVAIRGSDSVKCTILGNPKAGFTFMGTITENGLKLPIYALAKGTTENCHKQFGLKKRNNCVIDHSYSGWTTADVYNRYLVWLRKQLPKSKFGDIYLIADQFDAHWYTGVEQFAFERNIFLIRVPKGGTPLYQPLDRSVYGELKSIGQRMWEENFLGESIPKPTKENALDLLLVCWDKIPGNHIEKAWRFDWLEEEN
jgi:hypothetical protein